VLVQCYSNHALEGNMCALIDSNQPLHIFLSMNWNEQTEKYQELLKRPLFKMQAVQIRENGETYGRYSSEMITLLD
jgi:hypothetical protein